MELMCVVDVKVTGWLMCRHSFGKELGSELRHRHSMAELGTPIFLKDRINNDATEGSIGVTENSFFAPFARKYIMAAK